MTENFSINGNGQNAVKDFQTTTKIKSKSDVEFGLRVMKALGEESKNAYFSERNLRFAKNRQLANGRQNLSEFAEYFGEKGKIEYIKLKIKAIKIVATAISRMVGRWMQQTEKVVVSAVDEKSIGDKKKQYDDAEYIMENKPMLEELQQASGVPMVNPDKFIPQDRDELDLWATEQQRLPEEIKFEQGTNDILQASGWYDIIKEKVLTDSAVVGLIGCEIYAQRDGMISTEWIAPETLRYSKSEYPDFRDTTWRGRIKKMKIIEVREEYPKLSEETMFEIAQKSSQYATSGIYGYNTDWTSATERPYDDWSIDVLVAYVKTSDSDKYKMKVTKAGSLVIDKVDKEVVTTGTNKTFIKKDKYNIYKGILVLDTDIMLEWGIQKNMIRPQDPQELGDVEFPISMYMYDMYEMRNLAVPEKVEEPVDALILTRLKIQHIVATMRPPGNAYDIAGIQEIDLGDGIMTPIKLKQMSNQTGDYYFSSLNVAGERVEFPIRPMPNSEGLSQLQALIATYNHHLDVFRQEIGENENSGGQSPKPRVSADNYQSSLAVSFNAVDYMQRAYLYLMEDAAKKIGCLLKDSIEYEGKKYRKLMKADEVKGRMFSSKAEMLPTEEQVAYIETMLNQAMQSNPTFILYCDPFKIKRLAKSNSKLAEIYLRNAQKRAIQGQLEQAANQSKMNAEAQTAAAQSAAQGEAQIKQMEADFKVREIEAQGLNANKIAVVSMFAQLYGKGMGLPNELKPLSQAVIENIMIPMIASTEAQKEHIMQAIAAQQQQAQMQEQMPQEQATIEQPMV